MNIKITRGISLPQEVWEGLERIKRKTGEPLNAQILSALKKRDRDGK